MAESVIKAICDYKGIKYKSPSKSNNVYNNYVIKKGDTLSEIASSYNTSVSELKKINNLKDDFIKTGDILKLPNNLYTVKKGDSLWKIAKTNNTTINNLIKINNLKDTNLKIGQKLKLK